MADRQRTVDDAEAVTIELGGSYRLDRGGDRVGRRWTANAVDEAAIIEFDWSGRRTLHWKQCYMCTLGTPSRLDSEAQRARRCGPTVRRKTGMLRLSTGCV